MRCRRIGVPADLTGDWLAPLRGAGPRADRRTLWVAEGLLFHLAAPAVPALLAATAAAGWHPTVLTWAGAADANYGRLSAAPRTAAAGNASEFRGRPLGQHAGPNTAPEWWRLGGVASVPNHAGAS